MRSVHTCHVLSDRGRILDEVRVEVLHSLEQFIPFREQRNSSADCLLRAVLSDELPRGFLERLITCAYEQVLDSVREQLQ